MIKGKLKKNIAEKNAVKSQLVIAVFDSCSSDILRLDLSWLNLKIFELEDPEFKKLIASISFKNDHHDWALDNFGEFEKMLSDESGDHPYLYAFVPVDFSSPVSKKTFRQIEELLLVMFPSDFQLRNLLSYHEEEKGKFTISHWSPRDAYSQWWIKGENGGLEDFLLSFDKAETERVNKFFRLAWERLEKLSYLQLGIRSYVNSFSQQFDEMKFIGICITLESLTNSTTEVTHRIGRTCAVVNADSPEDGNTIYFNTNQFYSLRSAIVHGNNHKNLSKYFFNLQALVSRTLIELITLNVPDREKLSELVNESGYGSKSTWIGDYVKEDFNKEVSKLISVKVEKYSK